MKRAITLLLATLSLLAVTLTVGLAQTGGGYDLSWSTVDGGGGTFSTGGIFELGGTIGQFDAGSMSGGTFRVEGGFWGGVAGAIPTPTVTVTPPTATSTRTATVIVTATATVTRTGTPTITATHTRTSAPTYTGTATATITRTSMPTTTGTVTATASASATVTRTNTVITTTPTVTATPTCEALAANYVVTHTSGNPILPAANLVPGSICHGCIVPVTLPFPYTFYDQSFTSAQISPKGSVQFQSSLGGGSNVCLPTSSLNYAILPYWDDFSVSPLPVIGVFTDVVGTAPNRTFIIEWRVQNPTGPSSPDWELLLYEGQQRFDFIYRSAPGRGIGATIGAQEGTGDGTYRRVEWSCNTQSIQAGDRLTFDRNSCP